MFVERKIAGRLSGGEPLRQFRALNGWKILVDTVSDVAKAGMGLCRCVHFALNGLFCMAVFIFMLPMKVEGIWFCFCL